MLDIPAEIGPGAQRRHAVGYEPLKSEPGFPENGLEGKVETPTLARQTDPTMSG